MAPTRLIHSHNPLLLRPLPKIHQRPQAGQRRQPLRAGQLQRHRAINLGQSLAFWKIFSKADWRVRLLRPLRLGPLHPQFRQE